MLSGLDRAGQPLDVLLVVEQERALHDLVVALGQRLIEAIGGVSAVAGRRAAWQSRGHVGSSGGGVGGGQSEGWMRHSEHRLATSAESHG